MFKHLKTFEGSIRWYDEEGKLGPEEEYNEEPIVRNNPRPEPFVPIPACIDYNRMMNYIDRKYEIKNRDYHENYQGDDFRGGRERLGRRAYLDFWHWMLDHCFYEMHNPSHHSINVDEMLEDPETPEWVRQILKLIKLEFEDLFNQYGELDVWVYW
jgi:hypothetical protein